MKNKLSPIDELRAEKLKLQMECAEHERELLGNVIYLKDNFGSLLFSSVISASKNSVMSLFLHGKDNDGETSRFSNISSKIYAVAPIIWGVVQPLLIAMVTKKIKSLIFGKKHKKQY